MLKGFKDFVIRGNVVDMAVGIIIGASFSTIVKSLVDDIIMPPIGLLIGGVNFSNFFAVIKEGTTPGPYASLELAKNAGAITINYGILINNITTFLIVTFAVFLLINALESLKKKNNTVADPTTKECPHCLSIIPIAASKCAHCASELIPGKKL